MWDVAFVDRQTDRNVRIGLKILKTKFVTKTNAATQPGEASQVQVAGEQAAGNEQILRTGHHHHLSL